MKGKKLTDNERYSFKVFFKILHLVKTGEYKQGMNETQFTAKLNDLKGVLHEL